MVNIRRGILKPLSSFYSNPSQRKRATGQVLLQQMRSNLPRGKRPARCKSLVIPRIVCLEMKVANYFTRQIVRHGMCMRMWVRMRMRMRVHQAMRSSQNRLNIRLCIRTITAAIENIWERRVMLMVMRQARRASR
jgi:hypothetical protein